MQQFLAEHGKPLFMTASGVSGGAVSAWGIVEHVTSIASCIGAVAGAVVAICSAVWWIKKILKNS